MDKIIATINNQPALTSSLYRCRVIHERLSPRRHKFSYGIFMLYLDLDKLIAIDAACTIFSVDRPNLVSFYQSDHLKDCPGPDSLIEKLRLLAHSKGITTTIDSAFLLTMPRILGYVFNPVSFYFLFDQNKSPAGCVVEVSNTFQEMKTYVVTDSALNANGFFRLTVPKYFYVSPFGKLDDNFDFVLPVPGQSLRICINTVAGAGPASLSGDPVKILVSSLNGQSQPFSQWHLLSCLLRYPLVTIKVIGLIHWHALLLACKRVPFFRKEMDPQLQVDVLNPHRPFKDHLYAQTKGDSGGSNYV